MLNRAAANPNKYNNFRCLLKSGQALASPKRRSYISPAQAIPTAHGNRFGHVADRPHVAHLQEDMLMRPFDLAPLYRSTVGFDRLFSMLDGFESTPGYPPYNIERTAENEYRVSVAVAGFGENELSIESKENSLTIKGSKQVKEDQNGDVLYQGIAARAFERVFQLADYVQVKAAALENGLLHVDLVREIPEAKKPRQIPIGYGNTKPQTIETKVAA